uniref:Copper radical oxidase n=1 Tax=Phanerodontia chrysosporium TaxID=2822231 RepID=Q0ZKA5_PHACH|nr:copper radical oxidase [Phanerodontia chrysosporium]
MAPYSVLLLGALGLLSMHSHASLLPHVFRSEHDLSKRAPTLPDGWSSLGCYTDPPGGRTLSSASFTDTNGMTIESCVSFCNSKSAIFAGTEYGQECYCGDSIGNGGAPTDAGDCNMKCSGNSAETCGSGYRLSMYTNGKKPPPAPSIPATVGQWTSLGCYNDSVNARVLGITANPSGGVSLESCTSACQSMGFKLSGAEYADECYCGNSFANGGAPTQLSDCNMPCAANAGELCGGPNRLTVYNFTGSATTTSPPGGGSSSSSSSVSSTTSSTSSSTASSPTGTGVVTSGLPSGWKYGACYVDNAHGRIFQTQIPDSNTLTVESCVHTCAGQGFSIAGMEYSVQCFCGNELINGAVTAPDTDCGMPCGGKASEACGGPNRLSVYSSGPITALPVPSAQTTGLPGNWKYSGCIKEPTNGQHTFPYQIINSNNNSAEACLNQCAKFGYPAAGLEYGDECWCGDVSDVTNSGGGTAPDSDCGMACSGDPIHICGDGNRLTYYEYQGGLYNWHQPANTGRYELLIGGVVVPLVVTLGINNKIAMVEKFGTSEFDNSTGAYELDLSLVDDFSKAWRTMHVKSDVFCSASIVLPDKGARQLNVGGWSLDSTMGVRLYTPDGSPGVNGTNDWEENFNELHLQRQRWYPTALVLVNGSILVMGGEVGSNGAPEPSLEILPTPPGGPTWKFLDYLNRTDPNNLYPYLINLPSGRIFVGYYNEARILDPDTLDAVQVLPNMPGSVTSFLAGRTYPMEGSAVTFPQYAPYTDPMTVLICGGSNFGVALDNCVSIQPEVENPQWTIERMPSKRVMPCMAALPDGTFLNVNGAHQGVAGFGLGADPNYQAVLYDPSQPVGSRFFILNTTIVARMYHSEATLLYDGRVLVSGSDPQTPGLPEEMRIEVYCPPYLTDGRQQPSFAIRETDWAYGGHYQIQVTMHEGSTSTMRVSMVAATSSTHGNAMGGRTIFPAFTCNGNTCTITALPNAKVSPAGWQQLFVLDGPTPSHSHWVRIGGDPGRLGEWPNFPDFTLPGS